MPHLLNQELKSMVSAALQHSGSVYIVDLSELKNQVGPRWNRHKEMVWTRLDNMLQKLGPTDFHARLDDLSYLVTMPAATQEEAEIFCLRLLYDLHTDLLGRCQLSELQVARAVGVQDDVIETVPIAAEKYSQQLLGGRNDGPAEEDTAMPPLAERRKNPSRIPEVSHRFTPIWDAQKEAIASYRCVSLFDESLAENMGLAARNRFELAVTKMRIEHCACTLSHRLETGGKILIWIPVSYDVLGSPPARMEISALCRSLAPGLRSYVVFEISELPYGVPQSRLLELIGTLKPFCRGVVAQLPARIANYSAYLGAGLQAIGLSLLAGTASSTEIESEMFKLCAAARRQHIMCFVLGIHGEETLRSVYDMGVNLISGPLIGVPMDAPAPARRLFARDIPIAPPAMDVTSIGTAVHAS